MATISLIGFDPLVSAYIGLYIAHIYTERKLYCPRNVSEHILEIHNIQNNQVRNFFLP